MPRVPAYQRQVEQSRLPDARLNPSAPAGAFDGAELPSLEGVRQVAAKMYEEEREKADQLAVLNADRDLAFLEASLLYDQKTGALNTTGQEAFDIPERVQEAWKKGSSDIAQRLTNDRQRLAFQRSLNNREYDVQVAVQRHVSRERERYDTETTESFLAIEREAALVNYQDPSRIGLSIERQVAAITDYASRTGKSAEWKDKEVAKTVSQTHAGVVGRFLATGDDRLASEYYKTNKAAIRGEEATELEQALEEGSVRGESQRQADAIVTRHGSRARALEAVREIADPKVRDMAEQRVNQHFNTVRAIQQEEQNDLYLQATNMMDGSPGRPARDVIPSHIWTKLDLSMRTALERRSETSLRNNDPLWLMFLDLRPQELGAMDRSTFESKYWSHFDMPTRRRAEQEWSDARDMVASGRFDDPKHVATLTFRNIVGNALKTAGFISASKTFSDYTGTEAALYTQFESEAATAVEQYEIAKYGGQRRATTQEVQEIVDDLITQKVFVAKAWSRDPAKPAVAVAQDERGKAYVPLKDIPPDRLAEIRGLMMANGIRINNRNIERAYGAYLVNDVVRFKELTGIKE